MAQPLYFDTSLGLATSSGLSATMLLTHLLKSGEHIVCVDDVYGGMQWLNNIYMILNNYWIVLSKILRADKSFAFDWEK